MLVANIHQAKTNLSALIAAVLDGKDVVISKAGKPVVKMVQLKSHQIEKSYGSLKGKILISDDFDKENPLVNKMFYG